MKHSKKGLGKFLISQKNKKLDQHFPYFVLVGMVAIVGIVALVLLSNGRIEGAPVHKVQANDFQADCLDSDPKNDYYVAGTVKYANVKYLDYCKENNLFQYHCVTSNTVKPTSPYECSEGCSEGACAR